MNKTLNLHNRIHELEQEGTWLKQQLEDAQVEPPAAVTPPASGPTHDATQFYRATADRLERDFKWIQDEREQLQRQVEWV